MARRQRVRWHHRPWISSALAWIAANYIRLILYTGRWELRYAPATEDLVREGKPFIGAFWHGRLIMAFPAWHALITKLGIGTCPDIYVMSSAHGDGRLIQRTAYHLGARAIWGSSSRGGVKALRDAKKVLEDGSIVVMTPDGPRGPRMRSQPGVAYLAKSTNVPVVPMTFATKRLRMMNSWDRFMVVLPFARGTVAFGEPIGLPEKGDTESYRSLIEECMIAFSTEIDRAQGVDPVLPAS